MPCYHANSKDLTASRTRPGLAAMFDHCIRSTLMQLDHDMFEARSGALEA
jgi:hypothetical protein